MAPRSPSHMAGLAGRSYRTEPVSGRPSICGRVSTRSELTGMLNEYRRTAAGSPWERLPVLMPISALLHRKGLIVSSSLHQDRKGRMYGLIAVRLLAEQIHFRGTSLSQ